MKILTKIFILLAIFFNGIFVLADTITEMNIDNSAIQSVDFYPYMRDLQRRLKMNWDPPKSKTSNRVITQFTVTRDGQLVNPQILQSSGSEDADKAAINAINLTKVTRPLPQAFTGDKIDVQFTFDYNYYYTDEYKEWAKYHKRNKAAKS